MSINKMKRAAVKVEPDPPAKFPMPETDKYPKNLTQPTGDTRSYNEMADKVLTAHGLDPKNLDMVRGPVRQFLQKEGQGDYEPGDLDKLIQVARQKQGAEIRALQKEDVPLQSVGAELLERARAAIKKGGVADNPAKPATEATVLREATELEKKHKALLQGVTEGLRQSPAELKRAEDMREIQKMMTRPVKPKSTAKPPGTPPGGPVAPPVPQDRQSALEDQVKGKDVQALEKSILAKAAKVRQKGKKRALSEPRKSPADAEPVRSLSHPARATIFSPRASISITPEWAAKIRGKMKLHVTGTGKETPDATPVVAGEGDETPDASPRVESRAPSPPPRMIDLEQASNPDDERVAEAGEVTLPVMDLTKSPTATPAPLTRETTPELPETVDEVWMQAPDPRTNIPPEENPEALEEDPEALDAYLSDLGRDPSVERGFAQRRAERRGMEAEFEDRRARKRAEREERMGRDLRRRREDARLLLGRVFGHDQAPEQEELREGDPEMDVALREFWFDNDPEARAAEAARLQLATRAGLRSRHDSCKVFRLH